MQSNLVLHVALPRQIIIIGFGIYNPSAGAIEYDLSDDSPWSSTLSDTSIEIEPFSVDWFEITIEAPDEIESYPVITITAEDTTTGLLDDISIIEMIAP
jgi:hypothetical protein